MDLTLDEYEEARANPQRYLTLPGHEVVGAFPLDQNERVAFVEKLYASR